MLEEKYEVEDYPAGSVKCFSCGEVVPQEEFINEEGVCMWCLGINKETTSTNESS